MLYWPGMRGDVKDYVSRCSTCQTFTPEQCREPCKALFKKAQLDRKDPLLLVLALLDWRDTPSEGIRMSPVQWLMGRRTRTLLPAPEKLLRPEIPQSTGDRLTARKETQTKYIIETRRSCQNYTLVTIYA